MDSVRWNIVVSPDTDQSVRMFIAAQGGGRKGDLSRFIEEAVRSYLLEKAVEQAKTAASGVGESELTVMHGQAPPSDETAPRDERAASSAPVDLALPGHRVRPLEGASAAGATGVFHVN